jgi:hypothetical protein
VDSPLSQEGSRLSSWERHRNAAAVSPQADPSRRPGIDVLACRVNNDIDELRQQIEFATVMSRDEDN